MRRALMFALAVTVMLATDALPAVAQEAERPTTVASPSQDRAGVVIANPGAATPGEAAPARRAIRRSGPRRPPPEHVIERVQVRGGGGEPERCAIRSSFRRDTPMTPVEQSRFVWNDAYADNAGLGACEAARPARTATARLAEAFLRTIPLPVPEPAIAPDSQAITGLAAFLETNGTTTYTMEPEPTELGPLGVEATGAYWVDWGDGSPEAGPFAFEGAAYPHGRIWHHYRWTGDYTVTLRQTWTATWRLGNDTGMVDDLQTETTVPLEVTQVQAVIIR